MKKMLNIRIIDDNNIKNEKVSYIKNDDRIIFILDNVKNTINIKEKTYTRENEEYNLFIDLINKNCTLKLKKENYLLHLNVEYAILLTNQNIIQVSYKLETQENKVHLELELEGE